MDVSVGSQRRLTARELMLLNCGAGEDLRIPWRARRSNQLTYSKGNQCWIFTGKTDAEAPILWPPDVKNQLMGKDPHAGKDWRQGGEGDARVWDGWMASPTWWTWVWVGSGSWWWRWKPGVLQSMGSQRVRHDWGTKHLRKCKEDTVSKRNLYHRKPWKCKDFKKTEM